MPKIKINRDRCKGCLLCIASCPKGLIKQDKKFNSGGIRTVLFEDSGKCSGCTFCALICPDVCIEVFK
ncbi:MAG: 4Fe-4S binding protein [Candidatus Omnitrophica bacterium]|jgi:2-oxoglutarate ferredoxin oxidoreductase subunit delta|nr:4Fe-4S binding protein [Candidatus Omnitrophota bacterium]